LRNLAATVERIKQFGLKVEAAVMKPERAVMKLFSARSKKKVGPLSGVGLQEA
jgi:hypothetical protein